MNPLHCSLWLGFDPIISWLMGFKGDVATSHEAISLQNLSARRVGVLDLCPPRKWTSTTTMGSNPIRFDSNYVKNEQRLVFRLRTRTQPFHQTPMGKGSPSRRTPRWACENWNTSKNEDHSCVITANDDKLMKKFWNEKSKILILLKS